MTRFQKIQKISSIVPFFSTFFVAIVTIVVLKRNKASAKIWFYFILAFFISGIAVYLLNTIIMTGQHLFLNVLASGLILAAANILFVDIQIICTQTSRPKVYMTHKTKIVIFCVLAAVVIISIVLLLFLLLSPSVDIEDINGQENTHLAVIGIDEILSTTNHYSAFSSYLSQHGSKTNVLGKLKELDREEITFRCKKISGIKTLQATKTNYNQLTLEINSQLETGNMEIVILINDEYYDRVVANQSCTIVLTDIAEKTVVVKMAAESAKANIVIKRHLE